MKFTTLFFENLFNLGTIGSLDSSACIVSPTLNSTTTSVPTIGTGIGSTTMSLGTETIDCADAMDTELGSTAMVAIGSAVSSFGSGVSLNTSEAYQRTVEELNTTQAYMESLDKNELEDLIAKLETKNMQLSIEEENHQKIIKM